jgi:hypothetical protein
MKQPNFVERPPEVQDTPEFPEFIPIPPAAQVGNPRGVDHGRYRPDSRDARIQGTDQLSRRRDKGKGQGKGQSVNRSRDRSTVQGFNNGFKGQTRIQRTRIEQRKGQGKYWAEIHQFDLSNFLPAISTYSMEGLRPYAKAHRASGHRRRLRSQFERGRQIPKRPRPPRRPRVRRQVIGIFDVLAASADIQASSADAVNGAAFFLTNSARSAALASLA